MASCNGCGRTFSSTLALQDHRRSTGHIDASRERLTPPPLAAAQHQSSCHRHICGICQKHFAEPGHLQQHQSSLKHYLHCAVCESPFANADDLDEHRRASHMQACEGCEAFFDNTMDLRAHQHARGHYCCKECGQRFKDSGAREQHMQSKKHVSQYRCMDCKRDFVNEQALIQHLEDKVHEPPRDLVFERSDDDRDYSCNQCNRTFRCHDDLQNHLQSLAHKPLSNLKCMMSSRCKATFKSPSGLIQHLESGACHSGMDKAKLDGLILQHDVGNQITMDMKDLSLTAAPPTINQSSSWPPSLDLLSPNPIGARRGLTSQAGNFTFANQADKESFTKTALPTTNSKGKFACPLCPNNNKTRTFHSLEAFRNHIESPAHDPKIYHCPANVLLTPPNNNNNNNNNNSKEAGILIKDFSALSALTQHVESGACKGGRKMLEVAVGSVEQTLKELGFKGVQLLK
ncbi:MAG: hypothetical protein LQ346_009014 [Caloplaca aetnensis]|nr:MAG: hypothetical protein LQ346_009014 [Caloplaca aetnensis]